MAYSADVSQADTIVPETRRDVKKPPTVFIVDDRLAVLKSLEATVKTHSFLVQCYDSAERFIAELDSNQAGCILVDLVSTQGVAVKRWLNETDSLLAIVPIPACFASSSSEPQENWSASQEEISTLVNMLTDGIAGSIGRQVIREGSRR